MNILINHNWLLTFNTIKFNILFLNIKQSQNKRSLFISKSELEGKIRCKEDLHYVLRQGS